tara:strand:- start:580 stop:783 length:204 start_codon:yes stop_codon:yes gene_type:complete
MDIYKRIIEETEEYEDCVITRVVTEFFKENCRVESLRNIWLSDEEESKEVVGHQCNLECAKRNCESV